MRNVQRRLRPLFTGRHVTGSKADELASYQADLFLKVDLSTNEAIESIFEFPDFRVGFRHKV